MKIEIMCGMVSENLFVFGWGRVGFVVCKFVVIVVIVSRLVFVFVECWCWKVSLWFVL